MEKLKSFKGLKKGQKIRVTQTDGNGTNWEVGKFYTLVKDVVGDPSSLSGATYLGSAALNTAYIAAGLEVETSLTDLKAELKKEQDSKNAIIAELKRKIKFCEDNDVEEYDESTEKVYQVLKTINSKSTDMEKAQIIAKLINS